MDLDRQRPIDTRSGTRVKAEPSPYPTPYLHFLFTPPFTAVPFFLTASQELFPQAKNTQHAMSSFATKMIT